MAPAASPDYLRSQSVLRLPHLPPPAAVVLVAALRDSERLEERQRLGRALLGSLNDSFQLPEVSLTLVDRPQLHRTDDRGRLAQKTYGYYRCHIPHRDADPERCAIRIYHRTAVRAQVLAPGAFLQTLLHEWTHHFDFAGLRLSRSPHTAGFFTRLGWLADAVGASPGDALTGAGR